MMWRGVLVALIQTIWVLAPPALADTAPKDRIIAEMQAQGYERITVRNTPFGRMKITGYVDGQARIVTLNPRSGKVFEDISGPMAPPPGHRNTPDGTGLSY
ncbi:hypothetical protein [Shimia sp. SDUM112013]|uniref:hypothetical protein n=1 Tax=Shimia sp. SDUM112013 TaxID=3136160 RepID=UPI0032ED89F9